VEQIVAADVVLMNKVDLVDVPARVALAKRLRALNQLAPIHECEYSAVSVSDLLDEQAFVLEKHPAFEEGVRHLEDTGLQKEHPDHDAAVGSLVLVGHGDLEVKALKGWVEQVGNECGDDLWRVKGVVSVVGEPNKYVLQGVHQLVEVHSRIDSKWVEGAPASKGGRRCQIVLIGKDLGARRAALETSASEAFGFPLRVFNEDLQGPDPHAMPDIR
jgi:G3E family GTPase